MRLQRIVVIAAFLAPLAPSMACSQDVDAASVVKLMQGKWTITECVFYGRRSPQDTNKKVTIDGNQWRVGGTVLTFKIIADKTPMQIDFTLVERPEIRGKSNGNTAVWGTISVGKDTLKVCANWGNPAHPKRPMSLNDDRAAISYTMKRVVQPKSPAN